MIPMQKHTTLWIIQLTVVMSFISAGFSCEKSHIFTMLFIIIGAYGVGLILADDYKYSKKKKNLIEMFADCNEDAP